MHQILLTALFAPSSQAQLAPLVLVSGMTFGQQQHVVATLKSPTHSTQQERQEACMPVQQGNGSESLLGRWILT